MDLKSHWERVYQSTEPDRVSWFQPEAKLSLELIQKIAPDRVSKIIDVGAGASTLVDSLLTAGYRNITVVDLSVAALTRARHRLADRQGLVEWKEADVLTADLPAAAFDGGHDRAVFHFLTAPQQRTEYVSQVRHVLRPGAHALVATFAEDGPTRCSGLEVARYSPEALHHEFGAEFRLLESRREEHITPSGVRQSFTYCLCRYEPLASVNHAA
jgi:Methylase involved in ubiquinone/menaquinone biosynthesis